MLEINDTLDGRSGLEASRVVELLDVCEVYLLYLPGSVLSQQKEGTAMGSPVSAVAASLYIHVGFFENLHVARNSDPSRPQVWRR